MLIKGNNCWVCQNPFKHLLFVPDNLTAGASTFDVNEMIASQVMVVHSAPHAVCQNILFVTFDLAFPPDHRLNLGDACLSK